MNLTKEKNFSVLMAVYEKDCPIQLNEALNSLKTQTRQANEVLLVVDGPINDKLNAVLMSFSTVLNIKFIRLAENRGLANALRIGVLECKNEIIARMDSDDICLPDRFELQLNLIVDKNVDVVGGLIEEFNDIDNTLTIRTVPEEHPNILKTAKYKSPLNHVTVMFKKSKVIESGNYKDFRGIEDYPLWIDLILHGAKFYNIQKVLVKVRAGDEMVLRRGGLVYAKMEYEVMHYFYKIGFYNFFEFILISSLRFIARISGVKIRKLAYAIFRK